MRVDPYTGEPTHVSAVDRFDDGVIDTNVWTTPVIVGNLSVTETGGELRITTTGATPGTAHLQSKFRWGKYSTIESLIKIHNGESASDGQRCVAALTLWKAQNVYLKWGVYRDTSEAINSSAYLIFNGGAGETRVDCSGVAIDNATHAFKIILFESAVELYYDGELVTGFEFNTLINYNPRLEAENKNSGDQIDVRFDDFKIYNSADPFGTDLTTIETSITGIVTDIDELLIRLTTIRAGFIDHLNNPTFGLEALDTDLNTLLTRITPTRAGFIDLLNSATFGLEALDTDLNELLSRITTTRAGLIDSLNHGTHGLPALATGITTVNNNINLIRTGENVSIGTGTISLPSTAAVSIEFTTASFGSAFELTFIGNTAKATTGFEARAAANTILTIEIHKQIEGIYTALPQDIWAIQRTTTNTRNIDVNMVKCSENIRLRFKLDLTPSAAVEIPYRWMITRLKA